MVSLVVLVASGAWVRLSSSGLGCPTWPQCTAKQLVAPAEYHALVEFVNRCVITLVGVLIATTVASALLQRRKRRGVAWLAAGLAAGYVGEAVLGGITVLLKLNPALVAAHLVLAMLLISDAVVLHWRATGMRSPGRERSVAREQGWGARRLIDLIIAAIGLLIVAGTVATGSGPHSGSPGTPRFPFPFAAAAEFHAVIGAFVFGTIVALGFALRMHPRWQQANRGFFALVILVAVQGLLGYATYFSHVQVDVTEAHVVGAALVVVMALRLRLKVASGVRIRVSPGGQLARP